MRRWFGLGMGVGGSGSGCLRSGMERCTPRLSPGCSGSFVFAGDCSVPPTEVERNIARLMVRRHLRSWVRQGLSEEAISGHFVRLMNNYPDKSLKEIASIMDRVLRVSQERARQARLERRS